MFQGEISSIPSDPLCGLKLAFLKCMKNPLRKITKFTTKIQDYTLVASALEEFVLRQEKFIERVTWKSSLPPRLIKTLIHESVMIMTFSTLLGFDIGGLKGATIGSAVGVVITVGNAAFRIIYVRRESGIEVEVMGI